MAQNTPPPMAARCWFRTIPPTRTHRQVNSPARCSYESLKKLLESPTNEDGGCRRRWIVFPPGGIAAYRRPKPAFSFQSCDRGLKLELTSGAGVVYRSND